MHDFLFAARSIGRIDFVLPSMSIPIYTDSDQVAVMAYPFCGAGRTAMPKSARRG